MKHVISTNVVEPTSIVLMCINIKLNGHVLTILNIELTDAVFAENSEHTTPGILTRNLNNIFL